MSSPVQHINPLLLPAPCLTLPHPPTQPTPLSIQTTTIYYNIYGRYSPTTIHHIPRTSLSLHPSSTSLEIFISPIRYHYPLPTTRPLPATRLSPLVRPTRRHPIPSPRRRARRVRPLRTARPEQAVPDGRDDRPPLARTRVAPVVRVVCARLAGVIPGGGAGRGGEGSAHGGFVVALVAPAVALVALDLHVPAEGVAPLGWG